MYEKLIKDLELAQEMKVTVTVIYHAHVRMGIIEEITKDRWGHRIKIDGDIICIDEVDNVCYTYKGGKNFYCLTSNHNDAVYKTFIV